MGNDGSIVLKSEVERPMEERSQSTMVCPESQGASSDEEEAKVCGSAQRGKEK